jgi:hypothetical protein
MADYRRFRTEYMGCETRISKRVDCIVKQAEKVRPGYSAIILQDINIDCCLLVGGNE